MSPIERSCKSKAQMLLACVLAKHPQTSVYWKFFAFETLTTSNALKTCSVGPAFPVCQPPKMIQSRGYLLRTCALETAKDARSFIIDIKLARQETSNDSSKKKPIARPNSSSQTDTQISRWWSLNQWGLGYHHDHQRSNHAASREIPLSGLTPRWFRLFLSPFRSKLDESNSEQPAVRMSPLQAKTLPFQLCLLNLSGVSGISKQK